ncbi:MAG: DUF429 domain-containing protein [Nanoarchaeota archaeon]|nr:DUF429 domain-containing protein [Nanoarchaeota archaeon]
MIGGLDLSASEKKISGVCIMNDSVKTLSLKKDEEIIEALKDCEIVAIDAPLTFKSPWRKEEEELMKRGFKPLPLSLPSMRKLYERARRIKEKLESHGVEVIETFPGAFREKFRSLGRNKHEKDAYLCALSALAFKKGSYEKFGELVVPK